jgi:hypothetical protein
MFTAGMLYILGTDIFRLDQSSKGLKTGLVPSNESMQFHLMYCLNRSVYSGRRAVESWTIALPVGNGKVCLEDMEIFRKEPWAQSKEGSDARWHARSGRG